MRRTCRDERFARVPDVPPGAQILDPPRGQDALSDAEAWFAPRFAHGYSTSPTTVSALATQAPRPDAAPATSTPRPGAASSRRVALLWDLDNVTAGLAGDLALARQMMSRCHGSTLLYAAGHEGTYRSHKGLAAAGIVLLSGGWGLHGADRRLLRIGQALATRGVTAFMVASNDRAFAHLPDWCSITVLTLTPEAVSRRLRDRAREVVTLTRPQAGIP